MSYQFRVVPALFAALAAVTPVGMIAALGAVLWQADGVGVCTATNDQMWHQIASGELGGAIVTWWTPAAAVTSTPSGWIPMATCSGARTA